MAVYNFKRKIVGSNFVSPEFTITSGGVVVNLTGALVEMRIKRYGQERIIKKSPTDITITSAIGGKFKINSFVLNMRPANYSYSIILYLSDGTIIPYLHGRLPVLIE